MLKKIYKNNGIIYFNKDNLDEDKINREIVYNHIYLNNYVKYKNKLNKYEIKNISKKEYYSSLKCSY